MNVPLVALAALMGSMLWTTKSAKSLAAQNVAQQTPGGHAMTRPTMASQMWVDTAVNTALRNDAVGSHPNDVDAYLRNIYRMEAASHPGVRLIAHTVS